MCLASMSGIWCTKAWNVMVDKPRGMPHSCWDATSTRQSLLRGGKNWCCQLCYVKYPSTPSRPINDHFVQEEWRTERRHKNGNARQLMFNWCSVRVTELHVVTLSVRSKQASVLVGLINCDGLAYTLTFTYVSMFICSYIQYVDISPSLVPVYTISTAPEQNSTDTKGNKSVFCQ